MKIINQNYFETIDTQDKAYILGWIASDGSISDKVIRIEIHKKDYDILNEIKNKISDSLKINRVFGRNLIRLNICSTKMVKDVCNHLQILPGKKSNTVCFPKIDSSLTYHFIRGYFDGDGTITDPQTETGGHLRCDITSESENMLKSIKDLTSMGQISKNHVYWHSNNALDFLYKLYEGSTIKLSRKYSLFLKWKDWVPGLSGYKKFGSELSFRWQKTLHEAVAPFKVRPSDSGYDLTLIKLEKQINNVFLYDTGIKVRPEYGWYFELVGRSSIIKSGYILANSIGIIDRTYTGSIKVPLIKIDPNVADLVLPNKLVQIIPKPIIHMTAVEGEVDETDRSDGGFGSTSK